MFRDHRKILIPDWVWDSQSKDEFKQKLSKYLKTSYPEINKVIKVEKPFVIVDR